MPSSEYYHKVRFYAAEGHRDVPIVTKGICKSCHEDQYENVTGIRIDNERPMRGQRTRKGKPVW